MEECRQQVALSQGVRARLEVQRLLLKEKLEQLGSRDPPRALKLDTDSISLASNASNVSHVWQGLSRLLIITSVIQPELQNLAVLNQNPPENEPRYEEGGGCFG